MNQRVFVVPRELSGISVQALIHRMAGFPNSAAQGLVDAGCVQVGNRTVESHAEKLAAGSRISIIYDPHTRYRPRPRPRAGEGYRLIYEDGDILVVDKEAGILTVPTPDLKSTSLAERLFESLVSRGLKRPQLYAVHRLDRQVSGLLVFARSFEALWGLVPQFDTHVAHRSYLAIAEGQTTRSTGTLRSRLAVDAGSRRVRVVRDPDEGKPAVTHWRVLERFPGATFCRIELETGRKNQVRVQFAEMGHPLVGDERYGHASLLLPRVALHADNLEFEHPVQGGRVSFRSPVPESLFRLLHHLRSGGALSEPRLRPLSPEAAAELARLAQRWVGEPEAVDAHEPVERRRPDRQHSVGVAAAPIRSSFPERARAGQASRLPNPAGPRAGRHERSRGDLIQATGGAGAESGEEPRAGMARSRSRREVLRGRWAKGAGPPLGREGPRVGRGKSGEAGNSTSAAERAERRGVRGNAGRLRQPAEPVARKRTERDGRRSAQGAVESAAAGANRSEPDERKQGGREASRKPKAAWLRRREKNRQDPSLPDWVKRRMGLKPTRRK